MAEQMYYRTRDANGLYHRLSDVVGCTFTTDENGFKTASLTHKRDFKETYDDLALNSELVIGCRGNTAWTGRMDGNTGQPSQGQGSVGSSANGFYASTLDLGFNGTVSASATPEAMIGTFLNSTYLPQLSTLTSGLLTTGVTGAKYTTGNSGTDNEYVGDIIEAICQFGYAPGGSYDLTYRVVPAVWENRQLVTSLLKTTNPTTDYVVRRKNISVGGLRRSLSATYTRLVVRYKNLSGAFTITPFNDTTAQAALANYLGSGPVNYVRAKYLDWTSQGNLDPTVVANRANAILNDIKQVKVDTDSISVSRDYSIFSMAENQEIPNWKVRAGKWLRIPDRFPRGTASGSGTLAGDAGLSTYYYISATSYDCFSGELTLTPERSSSIEDFLN